MRERRLAPATRPPRDDAWGSIDVTAIGLSSRTARDST